MSAVHSPDRKPATGSSSPTLVLAVPPPTTPTRLCFIVEDKYRDHTMPAAVADALADWGHHVDLLRPNETVTSLSRLVAGDDDGYDGYDGYILKTVSGGPGVSILEAAGTVGRTTINDYRAVRLARDKAVAASLARAAGLPFPHTHFAPRAGLLEQLPRDAYPLVVKPSNGSACEHVYRVNDRAQLEALDLDDAGYLLAQRYLPNAGYDVKLYNTGDRVWAAVRRSPLHPGADVVEQLVPATPELAALAVRVGRTFGLDIYGVDVVDTPHGWVVLDVNDFPSFGHVPQAAERLALTILRIAARERARAARHSAVTLASDMRATA